MRVLCPVPPVLAVGWSIVAGVERSGISTWELTLTIFFQYVGLNASYVWVHGFR